MNFNGKIKRLELACIYCYLRLVLFYFGLIDETQDDGLDILLVMLTLRGIIVLQTDSLYLF